jgi:hypothetical protein
MSTLDKRFDFGAAAVAGAIAVVCLMGFEIVATTLNGAGSGGTPLRMIAATVLGRRALAPDYPFAAAAFVGVALCIALSVAFAAVFTAIVSWISVITEGELLTTSVELVLAGVVFGLVLWLVTVYVVAPLAGWTWLSENTHQTMAFMGAVLFGGGLGVALGRLRVTALRGA